MARKSLNDLSGIARTLADPMAHAKERPMRSTVPALGALQGALTAVRELEPILIEDWGPQDRLEAFTAVNEEDDAGFDALKASIADGGQQVPILVRPSEAKGRFEVVFGRRRLRACRELGIKVRANVQELDDQAALLAKGLENAARRNLSFYEKARFAAVIQDAGHDLKTTRKVLNLSASGLSHLTKVTQLVPDDLGDVIGAAPKSGRPKWTALAEALQAKKITAAAALTYLRKLDATIPSDDRLEGLLKEVARRGTRTRQTHEVTPVEGVTIKSGQGSIALSVKKSGKNAAFADWLDSNLEDIIKESYATFTAVNGRDDT